jgi:nickel/cobalt exporter
VNISGAEIGSERMVEGILYLVSSFWLGAVHAATPGHGKTIAASYIVGVRGRPVDALVLGIFVTLSHTSGIILVAVLATLGSAWLVPRRVEAYLALGTGALVVGIGLWMLRAQWSLLSPRARHEDDVATDGATTDVHAPDPLDRDPHHHHHHDGEPHHEHGPDHSHAVDPREHGPVYHSHGWGVCHTHDLDAIARTRPSLAILLGLGIAGGLLPDPGALAILLAAIASGKLILGLLTVLVFSLGFASVLVLVGVVAARVGQVVLLWLSSRWIIWVQIGAALIIVVVGLILTASAIRTVTTLR